MLRISLFVSTFLLTLAACLWATVAISRGPIERDLTERSSMALEGLEGYREDLCRIEFEGRDGHLTGEVKSIELKQEVERRLRELSGPRVIESDLEVRPYDAPWIMVKQKVGAGLEVEGLLSDEGERGRLSDGLKSSLGGDKQVEVQVEVRDRVEPAIWLPRLLEVAGELMPNADGGSIELRGGKLLLGGELPDKPAEQEIIKLAGEQFAGVDLKLEYSLTVAPPPEPAYFKLSPPRDGEITVAGRLADLAAAQELLAVLRIGGDWIVNDEIEVAENTVAAPWVEGLTYLLPSLMSEALDAGVTLEGGRLELVGQLESAEMAEAIGEVAQQNFPAPEFVIENRLIVVEPPREAMVSVITFPDGGVRLKGLVPEAEQRNRIISAVEEAMAGGQLIDELRAEANVMEADWVDALVGLLPSYVKQVKRGGLTIYSKILAVEAVIDSDADRDFVWAVTEQFFPDDDYRRVLELRYPEEVEGELDIDIDIDMEDEGRASADDLEVGIASDEEFPSNN